MSSIWRQKTEKIRLGNEYYLLFFGIYTKSRFRGSDRKASAYNAGDPGLIPGLERSPGEGNGNPLQYSCLENPRLVHGVAKSQTRLREFTHSLICQAKRLDSVKDVKDEFFFF